MSLRNALLAAIPIALAGSQPQLTWAAVLLGLGIGSYLTLVPEQLADQRPEPWLLALTDNLADRAGIPTPRLLVYQSPVPDARVRGAVQPSILVSTALLDQLTRDELTGVLAHEIAHVRLRHTHLFAAMRVAMRSFGSFGALLILAGRLWQLGPLIAMARLGMAGAERLQNRIVAVCEQSADRYAGCLCDPEWITRARQKIFQHLQGVA